MENVGVMMTTPMSAYLEQQLQQRFTLFKLWESSHSLADSVKAVVGDTKIGADSKLIDSLPRLEIVSTYSVASTKSTWKSAETEELGLPTPPTC